MIKAILFDALHTLFESKPTQMEMYHRILIERAGIDIPLSELENIINSILEKTEAMSEEMDNKQKGLIWGSFPEQILEAIGYKKDDLKEVAEKIRFDTWENPYNYYLYKDVKETLIALKENNLVIGCVSNENIHLNNFFVHFDIDQYFDFILVSEEVNCEKPNPKIFKEALNRLDLKAEEVIFVGDSLISDYVGPKNIGIEPILIDRTGAIGKNVNKINDLYKLIDYIRKDEHANSTS